MTGIVPNGPAHPGDSVEFRTDDPWYTRAQRWITHHKVVVASLAVALVLSGIGVAAGTYYFDSVPTPDRAAACPSRPRSTTPTARRRWRSWARRTGRCSVRRDERRGQAGHRGGRGPDVLDQRGHRLQRRAPGRLEQRHRRRAPRARRPSPSSTRGSRPTCKGVTYSRKLREAVIAWKLADKYSKEQILEFYLNTVPFGRGRVRHRGGRAGVLRQDGQRGRAGRRSR